MPGLLGVRTLSLVLSALKPPTKPGSTAASSPGKKQRRTKPFGTYIMTNFLCGLPAAVVAAAVASFGASECRNGSVIRAPLARRKDRRELVFIGCLAGVKLL